MVDNIKKIAIIGKGTAGCITALYFAKKFPNIKIDWYFDPNIPEKSVGEGSTLDFSDFLSESFNFIYPHIKDLLEGSYKYGIRKINYNGTGDFFHGFPLGRTGIHFNANKFQEFTYNYLKPKINIIPQSISDPSQIKASHIIDCSGTPSNFSPYHKITNIPVNSAHIVQCNWEKPEFDYTLTIARPYGWVFGIPLQKRCSIGYLYNKNVNTLEEVKEDIKEIFSQFNLIPSYESNSFNFSNYYKKENFTDKISYNGNASFFLEPLEATSLTNSIYNCVLIEKILLGEITKEEANLSYTKLIKETEEMITMHYFAGSKFNTPFWDMAYDLSLNNIQSMTKNPKFRLIFNQIKPHPKEEYQRFNSRPYGTWGSFSYSQNLYHLGLLNKIETLNINNNNHNLLF